MLMMLGVGAASGNKKKKAQLMLMMLGVGAASGKKGCSAGAHDAGRGCGFWQ